jgi:hypothetical protein
MHKQEFRSGADALPFIPDLFADLGDSTGPMPEHTDSPKSPVVESQVVQVPDEMQASESIEQAVPVDAAATAVPQVEESAPESVAVQEEGHGFTAYWRKYLAAVQAGDELISSTRRLSEGVFGMGCKVGRDIETRGMIDATRAEIASLLIRRAEREFAPFAGSLKVNATDYAHLLPKSFYKVEDADWDPDKLWEALEVAYGGERGAELGLRQLAESLVSLFWMKGKPPVRKSNRMELSVTVYCDSYSSGRTLSYNSSDSLRKILHGLIEFCRWAEDYQTASNLHRAIDTIASYHAKVVSRQRHELGSIEVLMFFERAVFEFHGAIADKLQLFIATYGREALERE